MLAGLSSPVRSKPPSALRAATFFSPLSGVQPGEAFDVMPYAEAVTEYLLSICRDIKMPRKLKIAFCNSLGAIRTSAPGISFSSS